MSIRIPRPVVNTIKQAVALPKCISFNSKTCTLDWDSTPLQEAVRMLPPPEPAVVLNNEVFEKVQTPEAAQKVFDLLLEEQKTEQKRLEAEADAHRKAEAEKSAKRKELKAVIKDLDDALAVEADKTSVIYAEMEEAAAQYRTVSSEVEELHNSACQITNRLDNIRSNGERYTKRTAELREAIVQDETKLEELKLVVEEKTAENEELQEKVAKQFEVLEEVTAKAQLASNELEEVASDCRDLQGSIDSANEALSLIPKAIADKQNEAEQYLNRTHELREQAEDLSTQVELVEAEVRTLECELHALVVPEEQVEKFIINDFIDGKNTIVFKPTKRSNERQINITTVPDVLWGDDDMAPVAGLTFLNKAGLEHPCYTNGNMVVVNASDDSQPVYDISVGGGLTPKTIKIVTEKHGNKKHRFAVITFGTDSRLPIEAIDEDGFTLKIDLSVRGK